MKLIFKSIIVLFYLCVLLLYNPTPNYCQNIYDKLKNGMEAYNKGDYKETVLILEKYLDKINDPEILYIVSLSYFNVGSYQNSINQISKNIITYPFVLKYILLRAKAYTEIKDYGNAIYDYEVINKYFPDSLEYYLNKGWVKFLNKDTLNAISDIEYVLSIEPHSIKANNILAILYFNIEDINRARELFNNTIYYDSQNDEANYYLGLIEQKLDLNSLEAINYFKKVKNTCFFRLKTDHFFA